MARFLPNQTIMADLNRFCLALGLGLAGALFTANMGWGASVAFLLSLIVGTVCIISLGGRLRVFHTGVFGAALVVPLLLQWSKSNLGPSGKEVITHLGISIALPMVLAQVVSWLSGSTKNPETDPVEVQKQNAEQGVAPNDR
jgi:hypothetical protein